VRPAAAWLVALAALLQATPAPVAAGDDGGVAGVLPGTAGGVPGAVSPPATGTAARSSATRPASRSSGGRPPATLLLDGERTEVRWTDGDSFRVLSGPHQGRGTRLQGYNTLEAFGPVHRWGGWTREELYALARSSAGLAASREWRCTSSGEEDRYHRLLVDCPEAAETLIRRGHAMAYSLAGPAPLSLLSAQEEARRSGAGMWAKGTPDHLLASVHAAGEAGLEGEVAYDRLVDARTGEARKVVHAGRYRTCQEVCRGEGGDRSCMTYVPFEIRYRNRPACLRRPP
jgi:endonuclease YncB( thermonuclease family)